MDRVERWIKQLKRGDDWTRVEAATVLCKIGDARAVPALIGALKDEDELVRERAAEALGKIGDSSAVPALIEALKDEDKSVRGRAAMALYIMGKNPENQEVLKAVPALIMALKDEDRGVREWAAVVLGEIRDPSAVPPLIEALKDENIDVRHAAAEALVEIGEPAVPVLIEALKDVSDDVRYRSGWALEKIGVNDEQFGRIIGMLKSEKARERDGAAKALFEIVSECKTLEELENIEKGVGEVSVALRKKRIDKGKLTDIQIDIAKLTNKIAKKKDELAPQKDLLLDDTPKAPKKGRGVYQTISKTRNHSR